MSEQAEARAAELLGELRAAEPPPHGDLAARVTHNARWQRPLRHVLVSVGAAANGAGGGLLSFLRRR